MKGDFIMSKKDSVKTANPLAPTAVAIGSAGLILGAPAAALLAAPGVAQAAPVAPAPQQLGLGDLGNLFGGSGLSGLTGGLPGLSGGLSGFDAIFGFFNAIPV